MKKIIGLILAAVLSLSLSGCTNTLPDSSGDVSFIMLGDSIADGYAVADNPSYQYANIIADKMGYTLINGAVTGDDTDDLLAKIKDEQSTAEYIRNADIIGISVGGNNLLHMSAAKIAKLTIQGSNGEEAKSLLNGLENGVSDIFAQIRLLNPHSPIYLQTVYNPFSGTTNLLYKAFEPTVANLCVKAKSIFEEICKNDSNAKIIDVYSGFKKHYDETQKTDYIFTDWIHPSRLGNSAIADMYINQFKADEKSGALVLPKKFDLQPIGEKCSVTPRFDSSLASIDSGAIVFSGESGKAFDGFVLNDDIPKNAIGITFNVQASRTDRLGVIAINGKSADDEHAFDTDSVYRVSGDEKVTVRIIFANHFSVDESGNAPKFNSFLIYLKNGGESCTVSDVNYILSK